MGVSRIARDCERSDFSGSGDNPPVLGPYAAHVDSQTDAREFLQSRRARLSPEESGFEFTGTRRRVPGLRREEVAQLAGVSVDYYTRLEKGRLETASPAVLDAIARALRLDQAERSHLMALARAARGDQADDTSPGRDLTVRPSLDWMLGAMSRCPAYIRNGRLDLLASNALGRALYEPMFDSAARSKNLAAFCFLDHRAKVFFPEWPDVAKETVALLRAELGRHPSDDAMSELVRHLFDGCEVFRSLWASHDVRQVLAETKCFEHPIVGPLTLALEALDVVADPGLTMVAYAAEPGSRSEEGLSHLSSLVTAG